MCDEHRILDLKKQSYEIYIEVTNIFVHNKRLIFCMLLEKYLIIRVRKSWAMSTIYLITTIPFEKKQMLTTCASFDPSRICCRGMQFEFQHL